MTILDDIVSQRKIDVDKLKSKDCQFGSNKIPLSLDNMAKLIEAELGPPRNLFDIIRKHQGQKNSKMFVAAEYKRASPSKGDILQNCDPGAGKQAAIYASAGAGLISVLTEPKWFKGNLDDMLEARRATNGIKCASTEHSPLVLRKDFIFDKFQLYEARAYGADSVLLMMSILKKGECALLVQMARELGMEPLVEVVDEKEACDAIDIGAKVLGVNNRNLHTFVVDMQTTTNIVKLLRDMGVCDDVVVLALSGIKTRADVKAYEDFGGIAGFLIGETLMRAPEPGKIISELIIDSEIYRLKTRVKICGLQDPESALVAAKAGADMIGVIFAGKSVRCVNTEQAKKITEEVRKFREMDVPVSISLPKKQGEGKGYCSEWFSTWGDKISNLCDGQARPLVVGVFMNQPLEEVNQIALETGIDLIQLHGNEDKAFEAQCVLPVLRVVHVAQDASSIDERDLMEGPAAILLLDTAVSREAAGGTGKSFDWSIAKTVHRPVILAGGLTPDNVVDAINVAHPWGVDVASGVESEPGKKDNNRIRAFIKNAKSWESNVIYEQQRGHKQQM